jgi:hemerythrin-like domain-containing protein
VEHGVSARGPETLHAAPASGFDQPFEMLGACHERVQRSLALLLRLGGHLQRHGADAQAADAARAVMRYFDVAGPAHHDDEERHVLPWLAAHGHLALAERLHADHGRMAADWARVRAALAEVVAGRWDRDAAAATLAGWEAFARLYAAHIEAEETQAYPPAAAAFDAAARDAMGREMAARRGAAGP